MSWQPLASKALPGSMSGALLALPSAIMWYECVVCTNAVRACFVFHVYMLVVLAAYKSMAWPRGRKEAPWTGFGSMLSVGLAAYGFCRAASAPGEYLGVPLGQLRITLESYGIRRPGAMTCFAAYFAAANPVLEELFWRRFARSRLAALVKTTPADVLAATAYAAYHAVIIATLMPLWFNILIAVPFLVLFGQILALVCDRHGLCTAVAIHAALDAAAAFWILDIRFGFLDDFFIPDALSPASRRRALPMSWVASAAALGVIEK